MTHYSILGLPQPHAPQTVIRERYKKLATQYSTADKFPDVSQPLTDKAIQWIQIELAYTTLMDDSQRKAYDHALEIFKKIQNYWHHKKYLEANRLFYSLDEIIPSLFSNPPHSENIFLAKDDILELATIANNLGLSAENQAASKTKEVKPSQLFSDAEQFFRIALVLRKFARYTVNRPSKCEINAVSNLCNFLHGRAQDAKKERNQAYADQLNNEKESLLNEFLVLLPEAILQMKNDEDNLLNSGTDFFEGFINLAIFYQERGLASKAKNYFFHSLEICRQINDQLKDPQSKIVILENETIVLRKLSELISIDEMRTLVDKYLQRYNEFSSDAKQHFLFIFQKLLSSDLSNGQWELAKQDINYALKLLKEITEVTYAVAIKLHLDCATILIREFGFDSLSEQGLQTSNSTTDKKSLPLTRDFSNIANILHHYRTAMNYAIYSRDLDSALLVCEKVSTFYIALSKQYSPEQTHYAALAHFFQAMTHFKESDLDEKTFNQIRFSYQKNRSTALLRSTCLRICGLYKKQYSNDATHFVHSDKFCNFIQAVAEQATLPFWKLPPPSMNKTETLKILHEKKEHISLTRLSSPARTEPVSSQARMVAPTRKNHWR